MPGWSLQPDCEPHRPARAEPRARRGRHARDDRAQHPRLDPGLARRGAARPRSRSRISDSIVDATTARARGDRRAHGRQFAHAALDIRRSTVIGQVRAHAIALGREQHLRRRRCASPGARSAACGSATCAPGSRTPRRYRCQPDLARTAVDEQHGAASRRRARSRRERATLRVAPELRQPALRHAGLLPGSRRRAPTRSAGRRRRVRDGRLPRPVPAAAAGQPRSAARAVHARPASTPASSSPTRSGSMKADIGRVTFDPDEALHRGSSCSRGACSSTPTGTSRSRSCCTPCATLARGPDRAVGRPARARSQLDAVSGGRARLPSAPGATTSTASACENDADDARLPHAAHYPVARRRAPRRAGRRPARYLPTSTSGSGSSRRPRTPTCARWPWAGRTPRRARRSSGRCAPRRSPRRSSRTSTCEAMPGAGPPAQQTRRPTAGGCGPGRASPRDELDRRARSTRRAATGSTRTRCSGSRSTAAGTAGDATFKWSLDTARSCSPVESLRRATRARSPPSAATPGSRWRPATGSSSRRRLRARTAPSRCSASRRSTPTDLT